MFGKEITEELKVAIRKVRGGSKTYAWEARLFDAMAEHDREDTLESLSKVRAVIKEIPQADAKENEESLESLEFVIDLEETRIERHQELERIAEKRMVENEFRVNSGLDLYKQTFGDPFTNVLAKMGDSSRWLDGGAGEAKAMIDYLDGGGKGKCVATGYRIPQQALERVKNATQTYSGRFHYADGKFLGEMSDNELGGKGFDLISDLNGVLYYTKTLVEDVKRYLDLLNVGGLLVFTNVHIEIDMPNAAAHPGSVPAIARWISNISGVRVVYHEKMGMYEVHKNSAENLVPDLVLNLYETQANQNDPIRKYSCVQQLPKEVVKG